ncbi:hypothetical protein BC629DRAFT_1598355 [Irpex lacteus]|nr:hypothetical protein BC629DRAFT_1598355 [Irpex lacteus]
MSLSTLSQLASDLKLDCDHNSDVSDNKVDLYTLPDEVLLHIISHVPVKGVVTLRKTSKRLYGLTNSRSVWRDAVKRDVIDRGLPMAAAHVEGGIDALSAQELESYAISVAQFNESWYSATPQLRKDVEFKAFMWHYPGQHSDIREVFFKGVSGEFLIVISGDTTVVWEVPFDGARPCRKVTNFTLGGGVRDVVVNDDPNHINALAWMCATLWNSTPRVAHASVVALDTSRGRLYPNGALEVPPEYRIYAMYGDFVIFGSPTGVIVWNASGPYLHWFTELQNHLFTDEDEVVAIKKVGDYIIVVRTKHVEIYNVPVWSARGQRFSDPGCIVAVFDITSGTAREAVITVRPGAKNNTHFSTTSTPPPVTILLLQTNNTLTQFDLVPRAHDNSVNPYHMSREPTRVFQVSPFACQLKVSSNGKGTWIQPQMLTGRDGEYSVQRVGVVGFDIYPPFHDLPPNPATPNPCDISLSRDNFSLGGSDSDVRVCQGHLYTVDDAADDTSGVTTVALDDTVGRLVVGYLSGNVRVLNFV